MFYNVEDVDEERKWLLDLLLEKSDADFGNAFCYSSSSRLAI
ncbi:unnamed protein product [Meloidogyne enterolobii]|uniref:Uncharacterized protein n=1 Tax=Meloidogyne enterolobii TaxID=390850 RepID=A0ACB0ZUK0_MELEN